MRQHLVTLGIAGAMLGAVFSAAAQQPAAPPAQQQPEAPSAQQQPTAPPMQQQPAAVPTQQQPAAPTQQPPAAASNAAAPPGGGFFGASAPARSPFPDGPGKEIVSVACTQCHGPNVFTQLRMGENAWRAQIYDMILRGAQIGPDDIDIAAKYMAKSYGPGVPFPGQQPVQVTLADGQGKELVEGGCALCHGLDRVVDTKRTKDQWQTIVNRMVYFGAPISGDQVTTVVGYLASNYAPSQTASK